MTIPATTRNAERPLYVWAALAAMVIVFAGFARTFYLKAIFDPSSLSVLLATHGTVMTGWFVLFFVQVRLVASQRVAMHRKLGIFGAALAMLVLILGVATAITAVRLGHVPPGGPPPRIFLAVPLGDMLVFACLVGAGLLLRKRSDYHKRFMLLSCVGILTPAIARIPLEAWQQAGIVQYFLASDAIVVACIAWDTIRNRRLHPAFIAGGLLVIASWPLRLAFTGTEAWARFTEWLAIP